MAEVEMIGRPQWKKSPPAQLSLPAILLTLPNTASAANSPDPQTSVLVTLSRASEFQEKALVERWEF